MKILMVLDREFPPDIRVENQLEALTAAGHQVGIACFTREGRPVVDTYRNVTVFRKPVGKFIYKSSVGCLRFPFYFSFWRKFIFSLLRDHEYDAVHIHDLPLATIGNELKRGYGVRFILDMHENWPALLDVADHTRSLPGRLLSSGRQWREYETRMCRQADKVIVVVEEARERLSGLGVAKEDISVVSNTLNKKNFIMPGQKPDPDCLTLFYAGGINRHRGLQDVVIALRDVVSEKPVHLVIAGDGNYLEKLRQTTRNQGVEDLVSFKGWLPFGEMNHLMGKADICLIPHKKSEHTDSTVPHKLFQYMYAKKAVVASDCLPLKRIIEQNNCGLIYSSGNTKELAGLISRLASDPVLIREMGEKGHDAVREKYLWEKDAATLARIYNGEEPR